MQFSQGVQVFQVLSLSLSKGLGEKRVFDSVKFSLDS